MTPADAARFILGHLAPLAPERQPLREALDAVLAEDVAGPLDLPPWDNSAMDGYAVRGADVAADVELEVIETVAAGQFPQRPLGPGQATRIFTGAPLPQGADGVIRQEDTRRLSEQRVAIVNPRDAGKNVRYRGEDVRRGDLVLPAGTPLGPAHLGVLASIACDRPLVHRRPRIAFLGSGDEIVELDQKAEILAGRKIASSNSYTLDALIRRAAAEAINVGIARDTKESVREHLERAAAFDLVVTTAGVSVGEHDFVREVLEEMGGELKLWRVQMRPGSPLGFGTLRGGTPWIGLPGNPVSTMVTFELFVRPAIRRLAGHALAFRRTVAVMLQESIALGPKLRHFLRAVVEAAPDGSLRARLTGPQGSGILTSMARANALLIVPEDMPAVAAGATLRALLLDDPHYVAEPPY